MAIAHQQVVELGDSYARELPELCLAWQAAPSSAPELVALNNELATELGIDPGALAGEDGVALLTGSAPAPVALAYAGHQFGGYSPRLGDGRALLLGEIVDPAGHRFDLHLKGSGRTPFARGGDGRAALGPMLREYLISESLHALGVPTTRSLAVVFTGDEVVRETVLPGAILARVAASHIRVGTFEYARATGEPGLVRRLADHSIARHHPAAGDADDPYLALFEHVVEAQSELIARWMAIGFVHGVMNTDNMSISGEGIDYGPCAFIDGFNSRAVFSSIDTGGRYAFGNQPHVAQWNLARFAETLLGEIDGSIEEAAGKASEVLGTFASRFNAHWSAAMKRKIGLDPEADDDGLVSSLLKGLEDGWIDFTSTFRALAGSLRGEQEAIDPLFAGSGGFEEWQAKWRARLEADGRELAEVAGAMDRVNPAYIPRNHLVEEALDSANGGDVAAFNELLEVLQHPFDERPGLERYAAPAPEGFGPYRTFCGT
ncbi:YdiU family protein [Thermoleophilia bacterium SCSIO 60948]|nr:YdiU family protein [Thermoleophilia bacterium SCSIO 60948]